MMGALGQARWLLALFVLVVGCAPYRRAEPPQPSAPVTAMTVMTFNLRYGTAADGANSWAHRRALVVDVIRESAPDVLGIQEGLRFQIDELRARLPEYAESGVGRVDGDTAGEYAAILYRADRFEVDEEGSFWFSETPEQPGSIAWGARIPRLCSWARLVERASGAAFYVYNVHLDHQSQESRERSVELLAARILQRSHRDPLIVAGDFNAGEKNPAMRYLVGGGHAPALDLRDSFRVVRPGATDVGTYHAFRGASDGPKIDAVLVSAEWDVLDAAIVRTMREGRYPSDHFPVEAALRLKAP